MGHNLQYVNVVLMPAVSEEQQPFQNSSLQEVLKLQGGGFLVGKFVLLVYFVQKHYSVVIFKHWKEMKGWNTGQRNIARLLLLLSYLYIINIFL